MSTEKPQGLFDKLYAAGKDILDAAKKPLVRGSIKRKLSAAHDDASSKIADAELAISKVREDFQNYDINKVLKARQEIKLAKQLQVEIKEEHLELFGKELVTDDDDAA